MSRITIRGNLDRVGPTGLVEGWCWSPEDPDSRREVILSVDGEEFATILCDMYRPDLLEASFGDGHHAFSTTISFVGLAGGEHRASLKDALTGAAFGKPVEFFIERQVPAIKSARAAVPHQPEQRPLEGHIDQLSEDGLIVGWCCNHANPDEPVTVAIAVDGEVIGTTLACLFRPDLSTIGGGHGKFGLRYVLPWSVLSGKGAIVVQLVDIQTNLPFGQPKTLRRRATADIQKQIAELERSGRALAAQVDSFAGRLNAQPNIADVFRTIGEFFNRFADNVERGASPTSNLALGAAARTIVDQYEPFTLRAPAKPLATVLINARGTFRDIYECLSAIQQADIDKDSRIVLLDDGLVEDAVLINSVVRGLDYRFATGGLAMAATRNELLSEADTDLIVFASAGVRPTSSWLQRTLETFQASEHHGAVTPLVLREDGLTHHAYLDPGERGQIADIGRAIAADDPLLAEERAVPAGAGFMLAVRRDALEPHISLQAQYDSLSAAICDLCYRIQQSGKSIIFQPKAIVHYHESEVSDPAASPAETDFPPSSLQLLTQRWGKKPNVAQDATSSTAAVE